MKILNFLFKLFKIIAAFIVLVITLFLAIIVVLMMYHICREQLIPMLKTDIKPLLVTGFIICSFFSFIVFGIPWAVNTIANLFKGKNDKIYKYGK